MADHQQNPQPPCDGLNSQTTGAFLDYAGEHAPDLHPLLHLMAYRGLRRGEACGLLAVEVRLDSSEQGPKIGIGNQGLVGT